MPGLVPGIQPTLALPFAFGWTPATSAGVTRNHMFVQEHQELRAVRIVPMVPAGQPPARLGHWEFAADCCTGPAGRGAGPVKEGRGPQ
jgi:hypothetical protein